MADTEQSALLPPTHIQLQLLIQLHTTTTTINNNIFILILIIIISFFGFPKNPLGFGESFIQNIQKVTLNSSYILPNGIIVLVDEDIEAYLNGTLVFYDRGNVPQVQ